MMFTLPSPNGGFQVGATPGGPVLVCRPLEQHAAHFFTTRGWQLGSTAAPADGSEAWRELARAIDVDSASIRVRNPGSTARRQSFTEAATGMAARPITGPRPATNSADIVVSDAGDAALAVGQPACRCSSPIAGRRSRPLTRAGAVWRCRFRWWRSSGWPANSAAGRPTSSSRSGRPSAPAAAGWRGCAARLHEAGFAASQLARWFTRNPTSSPSNPPMPSLPAARRADHWFFDGWQAARDQLESAGVPAGQVFVAAVCTASPPPACCSYRRDGAGADEAFARRSSNSASSRQYRSQTDRHCRR